MEIIAAILALFMTYITMSVSLLFVSWIAKAILLFLVGRKFNLPIPWIAFIPFCTEPYMGFMVSKIMMSVHIFLLVATFLSSGLPYFSLFIVLCLLYAATWLYTCYTLYQHNKMYTIITAFVPMLFPLFLYKTYMVKQK